MRVVHVSSELAPYSQTGGLAQVAYSLPEALVGLEGIEQVSIFTPLHRSVATALSSRGETLGPPHAQVCIQVGPRSYAGCFRSLQTASGLQIHFFECPSLFDREGIYEGSHGPYADNGERYAAFVKACLEAAEELIGAPPDLFHCHDWPTGLLSVLARTHYPSQARTVFTIHNLAYQGCFDKKLMQDLQLPWSTFTMQGLEFYDQVSTIKAGIAFSDATTTVSASYAEEIQTLEFGCHLDGFLKYDCPRLLGIRNGIDTAEWNPAEDPNIAESFDAESMSGKRRCRQALLDEYLIEAEESDLVIGVVSRLAGQKGLDLVAEVVPELHSMGARLVLVGNGEPDLEDRFRWLSLNFSHHLAVHIGFNTGRAHRVFAGADAFLMPSRFEPCGLGQMAAMRYGTIPIVHAVGGLRDTVNDPGDEAMSHGEGNGFCLDHLDADSLRSTLARAARIHREEPATWAALMRRGMGADWSWSASACEYLRLYEDLTRG
jgi:starch synthase